MRISLAVLFLFALPVSAAPIDDALKAPILERDRVLIETQNYLDAKVPKLPEFQTREQWETYARKLRDDALRIAYFRGEAAKWRDAKCNVEFLDTIPGGEGYKIRKLRYEVIPGLWIPALLYVPEKLADKVAVMLAVNGHDRNGKAADYKQIRCINLAKRGMYVLNTEWFNMGQLRADGFAHSRLNQIDLCGSSGLAPFFLAMSRGIDILLAQPNADKERVAVSGLSGGGWQTITISSLDPRVTLTNPVAGYSSFRTRIQHGKDLGDSEQTPCDLATVADYTHLTALMAPRPTLLTYNLKDNCCFESGYALPPLVEASNPIFKLFGAESKLRTHINRDPGDHNFGQDNREALYRMVGDHFFAGTNFDAKEIPCANEVKTGEQLNVPLPEVNLDFQKIALTLSKDLPRNRANVATLDDAKKWQVAAKQSLRDVLKLKELVAKLEEKSQETKDGLTVRKLIAKLSDSWSVPVVELSRGESKETVIVLNDRGRANTSMPYEELLKAGKRVIAVDLWYFGESKLPRHDYLFALTMGTVGDRPLGLQTAQLTAIAKAYGPVEVVAVGPRSSVIALCAASLSSDITALELRECMGTFREIIETNKSYETSPELFCFGLLETTDINQLVRMVAPRPVKLVRPAERALQTCGDVKEWYRMMGVKFDPLAKE